MSLFQPLIFGTWEELLAMADSLPTAEEMHDLARGIDPYANNVNAETFAPLLPVPPCQVVWEQESHDTSCMTPKNQYIADTMATIVWEQKPEYCGLKTFMDVPHPWRGKPGENHNPC